MPRSIDAERSAGSLPLAWNCLCVFHEGGQSLDQAFRFFLDMCSQALPRIASVQRILVADINNGVSYEKAIQRWVDNISVEEVRPLSSLFIDSLTHGTELVPHLRQFANDLTSKESAPLGPVSEQSRHSLRCDGALFFAGHPGLCHRAAVNGGCQLDGCVKMSITLQRQARHAAVCGRPLRGMPNTSKSESRTRFHEGNVLKNDQRSRRSLSCSHHPTYSVR